jgi:hypothetical protein
MRARLYLMLWDLALAKAVRDYSKVDRNDPRCPAAPLLRAVDEAPLLSPMAAGVTPHEEDPVQARPGSPIMMGHVGNRHGSRHASNGHSGTWAPRGQWMPCSRKRCPLILMRSPPCRVLTLQHLESRLPRLRMVRAGTLLLSCTMLTRWSLGSVLCHLKLGSLHKKLFTLLPPLGWSRCIAINGDAGCRTRRGAVPQFAHLWLSSQNLSAACYHILFKSDG